MLDLVGEHRRLVLRRADDDAGGVVLLAVVHDPEAEFGNVHLDVEIAESFGLPAPALHIGDDVVLGDGGAAIEGGDRCRPEHAVGGEAEALLEGLDGIDQRLVVSDVDLGVGRRLPEYPARRRRGAGAAAARARPSCRA